MILKKENYLLVKNGLYYRPDNKGYTGLRREAGGYHKNEEISEEGITSIHYDEAGACSEKCCAFEKAIELERRFILNKIYLFCATANNLDQVSDYIEKIKENP